MFWFPTWSDTYQAVQLQKLTRDLKFGIWKVEGLYYLCSENKGADQLPDYREADLGLCFRKCWFSHEVAHMFSQKDGSSVSVLLTLKAPNTKIVNFKHCRSK